jgi:hypothetical protein
MKIGKFVRCNIPAIFEYCETEDRSEFVRLQDGNYSKETFDINYPFCRPVDKISATDTVRYWAGAYHVFGVPVRVTSQWFNPPTSKSLQLFRKYMNTRKIPFQDNADLPGESLASLPLSNNQKARGRYKLHAIGNGQNAVIRYILGQLGEEQFSADDWNSVVKEFGNCCAYCGSRDAPVMDHIIPINKKHLGEHRLGNLVPSCRDCNSRKGSESIQEFLKEDPTKLEAIMAHMKNYGYSPIGDHGKTKKLLDMAHADIRQLTDRYIELIQMMLEEDAEDG